MCAVGSSVYMHLPPPPQCLAGQYTPSVTFRINIAEGEDWLAPLPPSPPHTNSHWAKVGKGLICNMVRSPRDGHY